MDLQYNAEELVFQQDVRDFLQNKFPEDIQHKTRNSLTLEKNDFVRWQKVLYEQGWVAESWPVEYGGTGWTPTQKHIFHIECAKAGAPRTIPFGLSMVGPVIYSFGNDEQKKQHLPKILSSDVWWCQGYSEPNAGSDLASLKTTAIRDGDDYIVNGTKTWTTMGHWADWIFCLVKTGPEGAKDQSSISFLLIDMNTPGITVSPIITLDGHREVNEVNLQNVRVPISNRIGEENQGWTYAKFLLMHERTGIGQVEISRVRLERLKQLKSESQLAEDAIFNHKLAEVEIDLLALENTELRTLASMSSGRPPGPESSILKVQGTEIAQAIDELYVELAGYYGMPFVPHQFEADYEGNFVGHGAMANWSPRYFNNRKLSIYGGTNEIQKNIICKAVLGI